MASANASAKFIDNFKRSRPASANLVQFLPFAAAFMCCIDGEISESEIEKISELGKKFLGKKFAKKELIQAVEEVSRLLANFDKTIFEKWEALTLETFSKMNLSSEGEKQALLAFFCELAFADGSVHIKEAQFVDQLSAAINFENPFELQIDNDPKKNHFEMSCWYLEGTVSQGMVVKLLTDVLVQSGFIPVKKRQECLIASARVVTANAEMSMALLGDNKDARKKAFSYFSKEIRNELG